MSEVIQIPLLLLCISALAVTIFMLLKIRLIVSGKPMSFLKIPKYYWRDNDDYSPQPTSWRVIERCEDIEVRGHKAKVLRISPENLGPECNKKIFFVYFSEKDVPDIIELNIPDRFYLQNVRDHSKANDVFTVNA